MSTGDASPGLPIQQDEHSLDQGNQDAQQAKQSPTSAGPSDPVSANQGKPPKDSMSTELPAGSFASHKKPTSDNPSNGKGRALGTSSVPDPDSSGQDTPPSIAVSGQGPDQPQQAAGSDLDPASAAAASSDCYRYEGDTCVYTDPSSGVEYVYSVEKEGWLRRDGADGGQPQHAPTLENCYYVGEHYCFRDAAGQVYRLNPGSNDWERWTPPAAAAEPAAAEASASDNCFQDSAGAWCCRDAAGALCRWSAEAGRWERAGPPPARKRRRNRGSSDDSEHDSDDDDADAPAAKRPAAGGATTDGAADDDPPAAADAAPDGGHDHDDYEWDAEKGAWFPKVDEEFLALHRLNYGFDSEGRPIDAPPILNSAPSPPEPPPPEKQTAGKQRKMSKKKPEWFQLDESKNTKVYVSGLPEDTTEAEFVELMSKCGLVMKDPLRGNAWKIKLYKDNYGVPKGDGICTYIKIESVNLALNILDGYEFKGKKIRVEKASFDMKGSFDPTKKPKKRALKKKDRERLQRKQEKLFAWQPDKIRGERERHERVVIIKNLFSPEEFQSRPELTLEYREDLREECSKFGAVRKVVLHDRHKDGVVEVIFEEAADADNCVLKMNGRWFAGRRLEAATWDGKTKYRVEETEAERAERLAKWEKFIAGEDKPAAGGDTGRAASKQAAGGGEVASGRAAAGGEAASDVPDEAGDAVPGQPEEVDAPVAGQAADAVGTTGTNDV